MRMRTALPMLFMAVAAIVLWLLVPWGSVMAWAAGAQREFQEAMARALRAVQGGDPAAVLTLCLATAAYGFVHALGPGHGKVLLGGAALASGATLKRITVLTFIVSLAQSASAIVMVGALAVVLGIGSRQLGLVADTWLAPLSSTAIAAIGAYLVVRGVRLWQHKQAAHCGHSHGPSVAQTETLTSFRDAAALVSSIALRPCTGALFVLVIALRFDMFWVGCLAVLTMGLGTASFTLLVAWSGVAARRLSAVSALVGEDAQRISASLHMLGGAFIMLISLTWLARVVL